MEKKQILNISVKKRDPLITSQSTRLFRWIFILSDECIIITKGKDTVVQSWSLSLMKKKKSLSLETANYAKPDNNLHLNTEFQ